MRILVADDDELTRELLDVVLVRAGHEVTVAADGEAAWAAFADTRPDVVLSDWMMPGLDGPGLVRRIRADDGTYAYVSCSPRSTTRRRCAGR